MVATRARALDRAAKTGKRGRIEAGRALTSTKVHDGSQPNDLCAAPDKEFRQNSNFYNSASK